MPSTTSLLLFSLLLVGSGWAQECIDDHEHCRFWSSRAECERNPEWMRRNCRVSCGTCQSTSQPFPPVNGGPTSPAQSPPSRPSTIPVGCNSVMTVEGCNVAWRWIQTPGDCTINMCYHKKFRSMDGTCNNFGRPVAGAAFSSYSRLLPSAYDDGVNAVVSSVSRRRPSPREVSVFLLSSARSLPSPSNSLLMQFGQFVSHDITSNSVSLLCNCDRADPICADVRSPPSSSDPAHQCIPFTRSFPICGTGVFGRPREQLNENTAFIDGSMIYGSEAISGRALRIGPMLRASIVNNRVFPPLQGGEMSTGDSRATLFVGLAAMHTSFLRLHNNVAARLQNMNRHWTPDRLFQESRKIVGAVIQAITYQEYLPKLLGPFHQRLIEPYEKYNPTVNPAIINEFASSAYRLHGMIQERYPLINANFQEVGSFSFLDGVNSVTAILSSLDSIYRGLISTPARSPQRITTSVTEKLFGNTDMATMNIQRGRDHGLRSYNDYRRLCRLPVVQDFRNWSEVTDNAVRERVAQLYRSPDEVDLYVGGILEEPVEGSMFGPTFACIIAEQFVRLRDGDRFYFENPAVFTSAQVAALRRVSLSWVLCNTGDNMSRLVRQAFEIDQGQRAVPCESIPALDLNPWLE